MRIRPAESVDLLQVVDVFWQCWTHTYAGSARLQGAMDPDRAAALWATALADEASTSLVAESAQDGADGGVLGVIRFRTEGEGWGYVASLYVAPSAHGRGVGRALLDAAEQALADAGAARARLWVFALNVGAQEFYRRLGWELSGERRTEETFGELQVQMTKALPAGTRPDNGGSNGAEEDDDARNRAARGARAGGRAGDRHTGGG